ncbi:helix-turn-helix domain-containing protein [Burkholderia gladioli]|uniref:helix-turn-helix domain-containing protein n=1 Tax=Burkholderia gladioli TaxID=28095 RepID=UPI001640F070|nr:helix-turn-helix domain-containing protein [Burkholderia gladioli]
MEKNPEFGRRLRERREKLGLSQKELADRVRISQPGIGKIEGGGGTSTTLGLALAAALETTIEWLEFGRHPARLGPPGFDLLDSVGRAKVEAYISGLLAQSNPTHTESPDEDRPRGD